MALRLDYANVRFNQGAALLNKERYKEAAASHREAIRLKPDFAHAHYNLGMSLLRLNDSKTAEIEFAETHRLDASLKSPIAGGK